MDAIKDVSYDIGHYIAAIPRFKRSWKSGHLIEKRLTIYQLEHELNQIVWNGPKQEEERIQRIAGWLDGKMGAIRYS